MRLMAGAFLLVLAAAPPGAAAGDPDVVRLKNGRFLSGTIQIDESDKEGFKVQRWDTGGTLYVRWSQIPEAEKNRLLNRSTDTGPVLDLIDGARALTATREELGVLIREDAQQVLIKTKNSRTPVPVPVSALLRPVEKLKIRESDAYSPEELVERRLAKANEKDYASMVDMGRFAAGLKLYEKAREFYQKAQAADASKKEEIEAIVAANEVLIKEGKAMALLREVKSLEEDTEFAKAIEVARKLMGEYADTETARQNKDLVATLEKEAKDFEVKKAEVLAQKVPEMYKAKRSSLLGEYAGTRYKLSQARTMVAKLDEEVVKYLQQKLKSTPEEIQTAWGKREQKMRTATYGDGSWIVKGGQDGGLDTEAEYTPRQQNQGSSVIDDFGNRTQRRPQQPPKPVKLGKKLPTAEEWWASASGADRKNWLEAEYAKTSGAVRKEVKTKPCNQCNGQGVLKSTRSGVPCDVKCSRCHGAKDDEIVQYW
jgi:tetratricopeptide (TPR) repeat protein